MTTKVKTIEKQGVIAVIRWNEKPVAGDFKKAYVSYVYAESNAEIDL